MPSFTKLPEQEQTQSHPESKRKVLGFFFEVEGKYGKFYKAFIDDKEYYLSPTRKKDKNGNPYLMFTEA